MAEAVTLAPAAAPAKAPKKKIVTKPKKAGPSVSNLIVRAVFASKEKLFFSIQRAAAPKKSLAASGYDVEKNNSRVKVAVKSLVTKGTGASGSFKLNKQQVRAKKNPATKAIAKPKNPLIIYYYCYLFLGRRPYPGRLTKYKRNTKCKNTYKA
ncbi:H1 protein, partial [Amia calva]|nr:H1 protein [Amia calva]